MHIKKKSSRFESLRWEDMFEEHVDIFKRLKCFQVMFISYSLFLLSAYTVIPNLFMLQNGIHCISWYLQISAGHFNISNLNVLKLANILLRRLDDLETSLLSYRCHRILQNRGGVQ